MTIRVGDVQIPARELPGRLAQTLRNGRPSVWTNYFFLLLAVIPQPPGSRVVVAVAAVILALGSAMWHALRDRWSQRADELGTMMLLSATAAAVWTPLTTAWLPVAVVPVWAFYLRRLHTTSSTLHFAGWSAVIVPALVLQIRWWTLVPVGFALAAIGLQFFGARSEHGLRHALWHLAIVASVASILILLRLV